MDLSQWLASGGVVDEMSVFPSARHLTAVDPQPRLPGDLQSHGPQIAGDLDFPFPDTKEGPVGEGETLALAGQRERLVVVLPKAVKDTVVDGRSSGPLDNHADSLFVLGNAAKHGDSRLGLLDRFVQ